ncbi:MAG: FAD-binding oxidoreductase [Gammaproteobacteria bacterium]|nr:MAG: FAD-binding oxidoreductase [Gammaproteobacteria bacterium]
MADPADDFLVIGAGIAGLSLGWALAATHRVRILEAEAQPGMHATGRSAAFYSRIYGDAVIRRLTAASREFLFEPPADFTGDALVEPRPCLVFARPGEEALLHERYREWRDAAPDLSLESAEFARQRLPVLRAEAVAGCLWEAGAQRIDVHALLQGYLRGFRARGGRLVANAAVTALLRDDETWTAVTPAGEFRGRQLIDAAGAWADEVAALAGARPLGIQPLKRTACIVDVAPATVADDWPAATDLQESFYIVPESGRLLLSPADETPVPPMDAWPGDLDVATAVDRLERATTLEVERVVNQWAGLRSFAPDRRPVLGPDPDVNGFFWCAGQGGYGIQTAPAMAALGAALAAGRAPPPALLAAGIDPAELAPGRFGGDA